EGEPGVHRMEVHEFANILRTQAVAIVAAVHPGLDCETVVREGDAARLLIEMSRTADLVVVGTHRMGRLRGFVLGSVSQRVAAHAACPVVTISGPVDHEREPILLGASATGGGLAALRFACEEARRRGVPVHAIRSVTTEDWALSGPEHLLTVTPDVMHSAAEIELDAVLREAAQIYPDVTVTGEVSDQDPFTALLQ